MRLVTCFDLSRVRLSDLGLTASHSARNRERSFTRRDAPALLGLGLEEMLVQPPTEPACVEALEVRLVLRRLDPHPEVRPSAAHRLHAAELFEGVHGLDRVVEELALVEDPTHPGPAEELVGTQDLEPEVVDRLHLGEEAMAPDVEPPAVTLDRPAD